MEHTDIDTHIQMNIRRICLFIVMLGVVARRWSHNNHYTNNFNSDKSYQTNHIKDSIKMRKMKNKEINKGILQPFCIVLTHVLTVISFKINVVIITTIIIIIIGERA